MQVKTKFWGKSMEVQPIGLVNLRLLRWSSSSSSPPKIIISILTTIIITTAVIITIITCSNRHKEDYTWNKATSCIHNILGGQRWVEHYGEVVVTNHTRGIVCKLNFAKVVFDVFSRSISSVARIVCSGTEKL